MKPARIVTRWSPILLNKQYVSLCGEDQFGDAWVSPGPCWRACLRDRLDR